MSEELASPGRRTLMLATFAGAASPALSMPGMHTENTTPRSAANENFPNGRAVLSGRVLAPDGTPVRGARLQLSHEQARVFTDDDGHFLWSGPVPGQGLLQCSLGDFSGATACQMSADLWLAGATGGPYQLHASQNQKVTRRLSLAVQQAS